MFVDLRLTELVMHGWDICSRLQPEAHLAPESLPAFMDMLAAAVPVRYRFEVTRPVPLRTDMVTAGDQARLEPAAAAPANVAFSCTTGPFVLLCYGRLSLSDAMAMDHIAAAGDAGLIPAFAQWFRGM
jgi:hypothetical protein